MVSSEKSSLDKTSWYKRSLRGTNLYGFELVVATIGLVVTAIAIIYGVYVFINHLLGIDDASTRRFLGELSIWLMSTMLVWLPFTLFFYIRTRAETQKNNVRVETPFHKFIMGAYRFLLLMTIIGLLFSAVFASIRLLIGVDDGVRDVVFRVIIPGLIGAVVAGYFMVAYNRSHRPSKTVFGVVVAVVSVLAIGAVLYISAGSIRNDSIDDKTASDLGYIQNEINNHYINEREIPFKLSQLNNIEKTTKSRLDKYEYVPVDRSRYKLCASFYTDTASSDKSTSPHMTGDQYVHYADFYKHTKGNNCFYFTANYLDESFTKG